MDTARVAIAVVLVVAYIGAMIFAAIDHTYQYPPGLSFIVGVAVTSLLGGPAVKRLKNLRVDVKPTTTEDAPHDES